MSLSTPSSPAVRRDRFGQEIPPGTALKPRDHETIRRCTRCRAVVAVFEIPAGYLDELGPYVCGECSAARDQAWWDSNGWKTKLGVPSGVSQGQAVRGLDNFAPAAPGEHEPVFAPVQSVVSRPPSRSEQ